MGTGQYFEHRRRGLGRRIRRHIQVASEDKLKFSENDKHIEYLDSFKTVHCKRKIAY